jgi:hypothetical protein
MRRSVLWALSFRTVEAAPVITRCGTLNKHAVSWMRLYPQTARSKRTSDAPSSNLALKRNAFSVITGTITHSFPTSGKGCSRNFRSTAF